MDLRVEWSDSIGPLDLSSVTVRTLRDGSGAAALGANLLEHWSVEQLDTTGLVVHERIDALLPQGRNFLVVSVRDSAGNEAADTVVFELPYAEVTKTLDTGRVGGHIRDAVYCADDDRVWLAAGPNIVAVDADSLRITADFRAWKAGVTIAKLQCFPGEPSIFATGTTVMLYHRETHVNTADVLGAYAANAMARSRVDPDLLYVGYDEAAAIGRINWRERRHIDVVPMEFSNVGWFDIISSMAVMPGDEKIYINRPVEGGILVIDPRTGELRKRIDLTGPDEPWSGYAGGFALSPDDRWLYVAVVHGIPRGLYRIDTATDEIDATLPLVGTAEDLALSPDGRRAFVTTQDLNSASPSRNVLVDVVSWRVLQEFERPRPAGELRWDGGIVFHPTLPLFFSGRTLKIDVYLNRK